MPARRRRSPSDSSGSTSSSRRKKKDAKRRKQKSRSRSSGAGTSAKQSRKSKQEKISASRNQSRPVENKSAAKAVPDWLADLFPQAGASQSAPVAVSASAAVAMEQVQIPLSMIGMLTAGNEALVRNVASISGATVQLRQDMQHFGYCLCFITGSSEKVAKAKEMLQQQVGLTGTLVTKEIDTSADTFGAQTALDLALAEMQKRKTHLPAHVMPPSGPDGKVKISLGPGQVAHVSMAEQLIRKQLGNVELEILYKSGRPVPIEMKVAKLCQFFENGGCILGARCQCCHGIEELTLAKKARVLQNPGAEIARGLDSADVPRWPPLPGEVRSLAPMVDAAEAVTVQTEGRSIQQKTATSGLI